MNGYDYDVIVVGAGSPGEHCAGELAGGGLKVAVVERELAGGECSYYACIPSKTLLRPGEAVHGAREAAATAEVDVAAALAYRDFMVSGYSDAGQRDWLASNGIDLIRGTGALAGPGVVEVAGQRYTAAHVVVATGSDPVIPPVPGLRELAGIWTNREVTGMKAIPRRLLILGGGPVGAEMAQAVRRFGGEVALVEAAPHVLAREPAPLGEALGEVLRRDGIDLHLGRQATAARRDGEDYVLVLDDGRELSGDRLLAATGRRPRVPAGLEAAGAVAGKHGIHVDARLRAADRLWAIGDATGIRLLTHVGKYQGEVVASNILGEEREAHYEAIPDVVYTDPQAAAVGATEAPFTATALLKDVAKTETYTHAYADSNGFLTLLSDGERLTGAYALGPEAGEWLQQANLAIRARVSLDVLRDVIQPFPTFSEIYVAALKALRRQIKALQGDQPTMPWFPDFASAAELARSQTRAAGHADPVRQYLTALNEGDTRALETAWPGEIVIFDPRSGEVRGHRELRRFVSHSQSVLAERRARTETLAATRSAGRAVVELVAHLSANGREVAWPVAVVAESRDERSVVFRSYFSRRPLDGQPHTRPPILSSGQASPGDVVGRYHTAVGAGDTDAVVGTFEPDGYYREPSGPRATHRGTAELRSFFAARFSAGGIGLEPCAVTDDGTRCALEYNCVRWGSRELPPQAGLGVYERGPDGLLAAARVYDDIEFPAELTR